VSCCRREQIAGLRLRPAAEGLLLYVHSKVQLEQQFCVSICFFKRRRKLCGARANRLASDDYEHWIRVRRRKRPLEELHLPAGRDFCNRRNREIADCRDIETVRTRKSASPDAIRTPINSFYTPKQILLILIDSCQTRASEKTETPPSFTKARRRLATTDMGLLCYAIGSFPGVTFG